MQIETDWVGKWYQLARERGDNVWFSFGEIKAGAAGGGHTVTWHDYSHEKVDGLGALMQYMDKTGWEFEARDFITHPLPKWAHWLSVLKGAYKAQASRKVKWNSLYGSQEVKQKPHELVWHIFSEGQTQSLHKKTKLLKVSLNSYLLTNFSNILAEQFVLEQNPFTWLVPVNLRGAILRKDFCSNHTSGLAIELTKGMRPQAVHGKIKQQLSGRNHLGVWLGLNIGRIIGLSGMRKIANRTIKKSHWMGTFTNLGVLPAKNRENKIDGLIVTPPGTANYPIGIGCMEYQGKLCISLKIHPSVCCRFDMVKEVFDKIIGQILAV